MQYIAKPSPFANVSLSSNHLWDITLFGSTTIKWVTFDIYFQMKSKLEVENKGIAPCHDCSYIIQHELIRLYIHMNLHHLHEC